MKNPFTKAEKIQRFLKVLVYGASGTGKTYFALNSPRPAAMIDLEGGSAHYGSHPVIGGFDRISTKSLSEIEAAISFCYGGHYKTLVVDPITIVWQLLQDAAMEVVGRRSKNRGKSEVELSLSVGDWGKIKRKYNSMMTSLVNLPCHVILICREKDVVKIDDRGNVELMGQKPEAEKSTPYLPDVIIQLRLDKGKRSALVQKDRTGTFAPWEEIADPSLSLWIGSSNGGGKEERLQRDDEIASANADQLEREDAPHWAKAKSHIDDPPAPVNVGKRRNGRPVDAGNGNNSKPIDWPSFWGDMRKLGIDGKEGSELLHRIMKVNSLTKCDPDDVRDLKRSIKLWQQIDSDNGAEEILSNLREDLECCEDLESMAEAWSAYQDKLSPLSQIAKAKAGIFKDALKAELLTARQEQEGEAA